MKIAASAKHALKAPPQDSGRGRSMTTRLFEKCAKAGIELPAAVREALRGFEIPLTRALHAGRSARIGRE